jgi:predicted O-methyltransferase YrrM
MRYFQKIVDLAKSKQAKVVLEIGSIRNNEPNYQIGDGHATMFWVNNFDEVYSYDIDPKATELTNFLAGTKGNLVAETRDGLEAINSFPKQIDLLYLDAWDVIPGTDYMEKHLEAFKLAEPKLHKESIVLIDDMEHGNLGKGGLVIPYAQSRGWQCVILGKQAILTR